MSYEATLVAEGVSEAEGGSEVICASGLFAKGLMGFHGWS